MGLEALLAKLEGRAVTSVTADTIDDVTPTPAPVLACTPVTAVTAGSGNTVSAAHYRWLVRYPGRANVVTCIPELTQAEVFAAYIGAIGAGPLEPIRRQPPAPLTGSDEAAIRAWLAQIKETHPAIIRHVLHQCRTDDARDYFMRQCREAHGPAPDPATEHRRAKALAMLASDPKLRLAVVVDDPDADPVVVMVARRRYTGEIEIPHAYYNPVTLLELLDQHSGMTL